MDRGASRAIAHVTAKSQTPLHSATEHAVKIQHFWARAMKSQGACGGIDSWPFFPALSSCQRRPLTHIYFCASWSTEPPRTSKTSTFWCAYLDAQSCLTLCDPMDRSSPGSSVLGGSPGKSTGVGCHALLQGSFLTQGWHSHLYVACGGTRILYH